MKQYFFINICYEYNSKDLLKTYPKILSCMLLLENVPDFVLIVALRVPFYSS